METTAIVLAGGKGSRMNNREKAWVLYKDKPLILHVIERIAPQVNRIVISRNRLDERYESLPYHCVEDQNQNFDGPLAGIAACSQHVSTECTLIVPCDTPHLPEDLVVRMQEKLDKSGLVIAKDSAGDQPLIMLARTDVLRSIQQYLDGGGRSVRGWVDSENAQRVDFKAGEHFFNINREDQLLSQ